MKMPSIILPLDMTPPSPPPSPARGEGRGIGLFSEQFLLSFEYRLSLLNEGLWNLQYDLLFPHKP